MAPEGQVLCKKVDTQLGPNNLYILRWLTSPVKIRENTTLSYVCHLCGGVVDRLQKWPVATLSQGTVRENIFKGSLYAFPSHPSHIMPYTYVLPCLYRYVCRACLRVTVTFQLGKPRQRHTTQLFILLWCRASATLGVLYCTSEAWGHVFLHTGGSTSTIHMAQGTRTRTLVCPYKHSSELICLKAFG